MKIPAIKKLIEQYSVEQLKKAEAALLEEQQPEISIEGNDEGEKLTHALAAIWIKEEMKKNNSEFTTELRAYTSRVRKSID